MMNRDLIRTFIILPGTVLVFIPLMLLFITKNFGLLLPSNYLFWPAFILSISGFILCYKTVRLFLTEGKGTPAPWNPPKKLVIKGPYCYVRNPMITGAILILAFETILLKSWAIAIWMAVFFTGKTLYFVFVEEKELTKRFGDRYTQYKNNVPRWIPRLQPWEIPPKG